MTATPNRSGKACPKGSDGVLQKQQRGRKDFRGSPSLCDGGLFNFSEEVRNGEKSKISTRKLEKGSEQT